MVLAQGTAFAQEKCCHKVGCSSPALRSSSSSLCSGTGPHTGQKLAQPLVGSAMDACRAHSLRRTTSTSCTKVIVMDSGDAVSLAGPAGRLLLVRFGNDTLKSRRVVKTFWYPPPNQPQTTCSLSVPNGSVARNVESMAFVRHRSWHEDFDSRQRFGQLWSRSNVFFTYGFGLVMSQSNYSPSKRQ